MSRDELLALRTETLDRLVRMRRVGDFGAGAADIRANAEALLLLIEDQLERKK